MSYTSTLFEKFDEPMHAVHGVARGRSVQRVETGAAFSRRARALVVAKTPNCGVVDRLDFRAIELKPDQEMSGCPYTRGDEAPREPCLIEVLLELPEAF